MPLQVLLLGRKYNQNTNVTGLPSLLLRLLVSFCRAAPEFYRNACALGAGKKEHLEGKKETGWKLSECPVMTR